jgi:hypothetical protein
MTLIDRAKDLFGDDIKIVNNPLLTSLIRNSTITGSYTTKVVISGNITEIYEYQNPVYTGTSNNKNGRTKQDSKNKEENREKHIIEIKKAIRRQINTNYVKGQARFITLTFKDNLQDLTEAHKQYKQFIRRFTRVLGKKPLYTAVIEFQKRKAIHYHIVFYNLPDKLDLTVMRSIWTEYTGGSINVKRITHVDNVGAYVTAYLSVDADKLIGRKSYLNSKGLKQPEEIKKGGIVGDLSPYITPESRVKFSKTFTIESTKNQVHYTQIITKGT